MLFNSIFFQCIRSSPIDARGWIRHITFRIVADSRQKWARRPPRLDSSSRSKAAKKTNGTTMQDKRFLAYAPFHFVFAAVRCWVFFSGQQKGLNGLDSRKADWSDRWPQRLPATNKHVVRRISPKHQHGRHFCDWDLRTSNFTCHILCRKAVLVL